MSEAIWYCTGCGRTCVTSELGSTACGCGGVMRVQSNEPILGFDAPRPGVAMKWPSPDYVARRIAFSDACEARLDAAPRWTPDVDWCFCGKRLEEPNHDH